MYESVSTENSSFSTSDSDIKEIKELKEAMTAATSSQKNALVDNILEALRSQVGIGIQLALASLVARVDKETRNADMDTMIKDKIVVFSTQITSANP